MTSSLLRASRRSLVLASASLALAVPATAQNEFFELGPSDTVSSLSADGSAAAGTNAFSYFRWTDSTGVVNIGGTPPGGGTGGQASMSNDGTRICGTFLNPGSGFFEMSLWDSNFGAWLPLGGIGASSGSETSQERK